MKKKTLLVIETDAELNTDEIVVSYGNEGSAKLTEVIEYPFEGDISPYLLYLLEKVIETAHTNDMNFAIPSHDDIMQVTLAVAAAREEVPVSLQRTINTELKKKRDAVSQ